MKVYKADDTSYHPLSFSTLTKPNYLNEKYVFQNWTLV